MSTLLLLCSTVFRSDRTKRISLDDLWYPDYGRQANYQRSNDSKSITSHRQTVMRSSMQEDCGLDAHLRSPLAFTTHRLAEAVFEQMSSIRQYGLPFVVRVT